MFAGGCLGPLKSPGPQSERTHCLLVKSFPAGPNNTAADGRWSQTPSAWVCSDRSGRSRVAPYSRGAGRALLTSRAETASSTNAFTVVGRRIALSYRLIGGSHHGSVTRARRLALLRLVDGLRFLVALSEAATRVAPAPPVPHGPEGRPAAASATRPARAKASAAGERSRSLRQANVREPTLSSHRTQLYPVTCAAKFSTCRNTSLRLRFP